MQAQEAGEDEPHPYGHGHGRHGRRRYLARANKTLQRALTFDRLEAGARNRGQLALAQVNFLQGDTESARIQALHALKKARQYELTWLAARSLHLLGDILAAQGQKPDAYQHFEQALQIFRACAMRLETDTHIAELYSCFAAGGWGYRDEPSTGIGLFARGIANV